jgi:hypothetical protein
MGCAPLDMSPWMCPPGPWAPGPIAFRPVPPARGRASPQVEQPTTPRKPEVRSPTVAQAPAFKSDERLAHYKAVVEPQRMSRMAADERAKLEARKAEVAAAEAREQEDKAAAAEDRRRDRELEDMDVKSLRK